MTGFTVVVTKSTVPVGTGDEVERIIREPQARRRLRRRLQSGIPARRRGHRGLQAARPRRGRHRRRARRASACASSTGRSTSTRRRSCSPSRRTSELIKYAANAFLAMKITFINEIADLCEKVGANVQDVARGIGLDKRIGPKFLHAGPGYGGSCFPKDTLALVQDRAATAAPLRIDRDDRRGQRRSASRPWRARSIAACGGNVRGKTIAMLGLTFKPNTDDMRDAPSLDIVPALQRPGRQGPGLRSRGHDAGRRRCSTSVELRRRTPTTAPRAPTRWSSSPSGTSSARSTSTGCKLLKRPVIVDLRNIYRPEEMAQHGFNYEGVGRPGLGERRRCRAPALSPTSVIGRPAIRRSRAAASASSCSTSARPTPPATGRCGAISSSSSPTSA